MISGFQGLPSDPGTAKWAKAHESELGGAEPNDSTEPPINADKLSVQRTDPENFDNIINGDKATEFSDPASKAQDQDRIQTLRDSIKQNGIQTPVRVNVRTGEVVDGNSRVEAARAEDVHIPWTSVTGEGKEHAADHAQDIFKPATKPAHRRDE
jgi:hypothetical protein